MWVVVMLTTLGETRSTKSAMLDWVGSCACGASCTAGASLLLGRKSACRGWLELQPVASAKVSKVAGTNSARGERIVGLS